MFKNVAGTFLVFAFDATTNVPKTGDAANITAYVAIDAGAVTVLGDTSATEFDATNAPGYYWFTGAQAETNGDRLMVTGKSSTANIKVIGAPAVIFTRPTTGWLAPATAGRTLVVDASGLADANMVKAGPTGSGTAQTAGDIYGLSVIIASYIDTEVTSIKTQTDKLTFTVPNQLDVNVLDWKSATAPAMTGDAFARLGAPAGASTAADIAAVKVDTAAVKVQTDKFVFTVPNQVDCNVLTFSTAFRAGIRKNVALANFEILMTDSTNHNPATGLTVTITRSIDGGAFAAGTLGAVTELSNGIYKFDFAAGDLNGTIITLRATAVGADDLFLTIHTDP